MTSSTSTPNATEQSGNSDIRVVHTIRTPSLSGTCDLEAQLGLCDTGILHIRISSSTGNGYYCRNWVGLDKLWSHLSDWPHDTITALSLFPIWEFRSINTAGYILKVLIDLGLLNPSTEKQRHWDLVSEEKFQAIVADLKAKHQSKSHSPAGKRKAKTTA